MAIWTRQGDVIKMVLRQGGTLTGIGLLIGLPVSYFLSLLLQEGLTTLTFNPITFLLLTRLLVAVTVVASAIPALRATGVDPMIALRTE
jgi:ABC-type antimicrobial peptide transport system permease subunit